jgi:hypothetical protein
MWAVMKKISNESPQSPAYPVDLNKSPQLKVDMDGPRGSCGLESRLERFFARAFSL